MRVLFWPALINEIEAKSASYEFTGFLVYKKF